MIIKDKILLFYLEASSVLYNSLDSINYAPTMDLLMVITKKAEKFHGQNSILVIYTVIK